MFIMDFSKFSFILLIQCFIYASPWVGQLSWTYVGNGSLYFHEINIFCNSANFDLASNCFSNFPLRKILETFNSNFVLEVISNIFLSMRKRTFTEENCVLPQYFRSWTINMHTYQSKITFWYNLKISFHITGIICYEWIRNIYFR